MRTSFLFGLALTLSLSFHVAADEEKVAKPNFDGLGNRICNVYNNEKLVNFARSAIYNHAKEFYGEPFTRYRDKTPSPEKTEELRKVISMMNQNAGEIKCGGKHFIHRAFEKGKYHEVVAQLLFRVLADREKGIHYDFNAITMTDDPTTDEVKLVPMTVLDYIDKVALNTTSISGSEPDQIRINAIRRAMVKHFGAVGYADLTDDNMASIEKTRMASFGATGQVKSGHITNTETMLQFALGNQYQGIKSSKQTLIREFERTYAKRPVCRYSEDDIRYLHHHHGYISKSAFSKDLNDINELVNYSICSLSEYRMDSDLIRLLNELETTEPQPFDTKTAYLTRCKTMMQKYGNEESFMVDVVCNTSQN